MKKLTLFCGLLIALSAFTLVTKAQSAKLLSTTNLTTLDTVTNAGTRIQDCSISGYNAVAVQANLVSLTGTVAGTLTLWGSSDGVNFVQIPTLSDAGALGLENITVSPSLLTKIFRVPISYYTKYQVRLTGSGTQATTLSSAAIWRLIPH